LPNWRKEFVLEQVTPPTSADFTSRLNAILEEAHREGKDAVTVLAGNLHRQVSGYPARNHRMPVCCSVMRRKMGSSDEVIYAPPKGSGATLLVRYRFTKH